MILLDASVLIEYVEGRRHAEEVRKRLTAYRPNQVHICAVTVFEVEFGLWPGSPNIRARREVWRDFYRGGIVAEMLYDTIAERAAAVVHQTAALGWQIGKFDAIVAATALHEGLTVAASDKGFNHVRGLKYERWF